MIYPMRHGDSFYPSFPFLVLLYSFSKVREGDDKPVMTSTYYVTQTPGLHMIKLVIHVAVTMFLHALHYIVIFKTGVIIDLDK